MCEWKYCLALLEGKEVLNAKPVKDKSSLVSDELKKELSDFFHPINIAVSTFLDDLMKMNTPRTVAMVVPQVSNHKCTSTHVWWCTN